MITRFAAIDKFLGPWVDQLAQIRKGDEYAVILSELENPEDPGLAKSLSLLDDHLSIASDTCSNFLDVLKEKPKLPTLIDEANTTVLNKLSEIRAVVGLSRLGFRDIQFSGTPDFTAYRNDAACAIEVTRLGRSLGRRSDVWDYEAGAPDLESLEEVGYHVGLMSSGGKVHDALSEAIYREIEEKYRQIRGAQGTNLRMIWISLGRDYLTCGLYELPGIGSLKNMSRTISGFVASAVQSHRIGLC